VKIRSLSSYEVFEAELSTENSVVTVEGVAVRPLGMEVIEATLDELEVLPPQWTIADLCGISMRVITK
jgi:hypothetical protein